MWSRSPVGVSIYFWPQYITSWCHCKILISVESHPPISGIQQNQYMVHVSSLMCWSAHCNCRSEGKWNRVCWVRCSVLMPPVPLKGLVLQMLHIVHIERNCSDLRIKTSDKLFFIMLFISPAVRWCNLSVVNVFLASSAPNNTQLQKSFAEHNYQIFISAW